MRIEQRIVGPVQTNCYCLIGEKEALVVDPGADAAKIAQIVEEAQVTCVGILLTHGHFDHAGAARELSGRLGGVKIYAHEQEEEVLKRPEWNLSGGFTGVQECFEADVYLRGEKGELSIGEFHFSYYHTPGHTQGGVCYYFPEEKLLLSGDTLFCESVGRSDFPTGGSAQLVRSIKEQLLDLEDDTNVLPGHGGSTTIGTERAYNPFLS